MLPGNELAPKAHIAGFSFPVKQPHDQLIDWELAGIAINDPSQGLRVQLWTLEGKLNETTGLIDVIVSAPSVAPTVLFSGADISEVALSFDQNMNPFVAYMQAGSAKIYWYDPLIPGMTHTTLPSGCYDLRCTLDDKRGFAVGDSDIVLAYIRAGNLCVRYQSDRYGVENIQRAGAGSNARLVSMAMNNGSRLQFRLRNYELTGDPGALVATEPFLGDIVYDLCRQAGIPPENIDVSELYDPVKDRVPGLLVDSDDGLDKPISWLMDMFQFDKVEHGGKLRFIKRGRPVVARIPFNKLVDDYPKTLKRTERDRAKLPRTVNINHIDPDGGFAKNKQSASRRTNMSAGTGTKNIESRVVLKAGQAADAALRKLKILHNEYEDFEFTTRLEYTYLTPGDVVEVEDFDGTWYRMHLTERNEDDGNIKWEAETDGGYLVYDNVAVPGKPLDPPVSTTPGTIGETELDIFNLPVNRDTNDELVLYVGARGGGSGWDGAALYASPDGGTTYSDTGTVIEFAANIGETLTAVTSTSTSVEVLVPEPLSSATAAQLNAGANRAIIGDEEVQWQDATLLGMSGALYHYNLTGLRRNVLHSGAEAWGSGIRFAEFNDAIIAARIDRSYYGATLYYKAVSLGGTVDGATALSYAFTYAASQTEWPVTNVVVTAAATGGITVTWDGSPRIGTFGPSPYHSKYMIGYRVKFSDGHTIDTTLETVTYASGLMGTVVEVRALNSITGEGPLADGSGEVDPGDVPSFSFAGSLPDGYAGVPYVLFNGEGGVLAKGGYWDANVRGFAVPAIGAFCTTPTTLDGFRLAGIPTTAGTYTSSVYLDSSAPPPEGPHDTVIAQSIEVLPRPSFATFDFTFRQEFFSRLVDTSPPWKKFEFYNGGSMWFYGFTSGKRVAQFKIAGSTFPVLIGINNAKGELSIGDNAIGVGPFGAAHSANDGTYSVELDAGTGDYWIYKDGDGLKKSGNIGLDAGKQYRICVTSEYVQTFTVEGNAGNESWFMPITQSGHTGIPMPSIPIPAAWASIDPPTAASMQGGGSRGCFVAAKAAVQCVVKGNKGYTTGRHRFLITGSARSGICVAGFDATDAAAGLGAAGTHDSVGWGRGAGFGTLSWCFSGANGSMDLVMPAPGIYPFPIFALDADGNTLKVCGQQANGDVVVLQTVSLPSGKTWFIAATGQPTACVLTYDPPGPSGYADAVVP